MIPVKVEKISYHASSRSYAVLLKEIGGERLLPVVVGSFEAQSIALALEVVETPRPLTHDLICEMIQGIDATLKTVKIRDLNDGIFYACMEIEGADFGFRSIDARPSDAIAVALRLNTPILVSMDVIQEAGVSEKEVKVEEQKSKMPEFKLSDLQKKLENAIEEEDYEIAAKLRDKINAIDS